MWLRAWRRGLCGAFPVNSQHGNKEDKSHTLQQQTGDRPEWRVSRTDGGFVIILMSSSGLTQQAIISLWEGRKLERKPMEKTREWEEDDDDHVVKSGQFGGVKGKEAEEPGYRFVADITTFGKERTLTEEEEHWFSLPLRSLVQTTHQTLHLPGIRERNLSSLFSISQAFTWPLVTDFPSPVAQNPSLSRLCNKWTPNITD